MAAVIKSFTQKPIPRNKEMLNLISQLIGQSKKPNACKMQDCVVVGSSGVSMDGVAGAAKGGSIAGITGALTGESIVKDELTGGDVVPIQLETLELQRASSTEATSEPRKQELLELRTAGPPKEKLEPLREKLLELQLATDGISGKDSGVANGEATGAAMGEITCGEREAATGDATGAVTGASLEKRTEPQREMLLVLRRVG